MVSDYPGHPDSGCPAPDGDVPGPKARLEAAKQGLDSSATVQPAVSRPADGPATRRKPTLRAIDEHEKGARWIFILMAVLLGLALIAQYVRSQG